LESICDLINAILHHDDWNPLSLYATDAQEHVPPKELLPDDVPLRIGSNLIIEIPIDTRRTINVYINDCIGLTVNIENTNNATLLKQTFSLRLTAVSCKVSPKESLPYDNMDARAKLKAKTGLTKIKVILGWMFNFRTMTMALPKNKLIAYSKEISDMLD
jgi:hypothetical protein